MKKGIIIFPLLAILAGCGAKDETAVVDYTIETDVVPGTGCFTDPVIDDNVVDLNVKVPVETDYGDYTFTLKNVRGWSWDCYDKEGYRGIVFQADIENESYKFVYNDGKSVNGLNGEIYSNLKVVDQDGYVCEGYHSFYIDNYRPFSDILMPGEKSRGTFGFYIPEGKQTITVKFKDQDIATFDF